MYSRKLQILVEALGKYYSSNDECLFFCPFCEHHKRKLSVNISKNTYKCWICDSHGRNIYYIIKRFGNYEQKQEWKSFDNEIEITEFDNLFKEEAEELEQQIKLPKEYTCLANKNLRSDSKLALNYLKKRGIIDSDILKWKIGYCDDGQYKNRIIIPSFSNSGHCNYFVARSYAENWMKYKNPPVSRNIIFNELMIDWKEPITLVEGVFDAINAENSVPLLGSTLSVRSKLFKTILTHSKRIYVATDKDAEKKALNIVNALISHGIEVYKIDTSDYEDVGEMTKETFKERKDKAVYIDSTNFLFYKMQNTL